MWLYPLRRLGESGLSAGAREKLLSIVRCSKLRRPHTTRGHGKTVAFVLLRFHPTLP